MASHQLNLNEHNDLPNLKTNKLIKRPVMVIDSKRNDVGKNTECSDILPNTNAIDQKL